MNSDGASLNVDIYRVHPGYFTFTCIDKGSGVTKFDGDYLAYKFHWANMLYILFLKMQILCVHRGKTVNKTTIKRGR